MTHGNRFNSSTSQLKLFNSMVYDSLSSAGNTLVLNITNTTANFNVSRWCYEEWAELEGANFGLLVMTSDTLVVNLGLKSRNEFGAKDCCVCVPCFQKWKNVWVVCTPARPKERFETRETWGAQKRFAFNWPVAVNCVTATLPCSSPRICFTLISIFKRSRTNFFYPKKPNIFKSSRTVARAARLSKGKTTAVSGLSHIANADVS